MKKIIITTLLFIFSINIVAQNDSIVRARNYNYIDSYKDYWRTVTFKIGGGLYIPQGDLNNYFESSPLFEMSLDFPVTDNKSLELALQFILPKQKESFKYVNTVDEAEAALIFNPMLRFKKDLSKNETSKFLIGLGVGASVIGLNQNIGLTNEKEKTEITSFMIAPSLDYVKSFKNKEQLTFSLGLNYSPYKIKGILDEKIGGLAITPRLLYSF
ncbi:MAG: hypothetical protein EVB11_08450 [Winogradskyella sp.]|nr:MAG: hypothetical protein EVB11_08450 [Winogradskyella sp.]